MLQHSTVRLANMKSFWKLAGFEVGTRIRCEFSYCNDKKVSENSELLEVGDMWEVEREWTSASFQTSDSDEPVQVFQDDSGAIIVSAVLTISI